MMASHSQRQPSVIVVGAGISGLSAAWRLIDAGFKDVLILEANNRIGGRIHTVPFGDGDMPVELGANWIHGPTIENSTFRIAETIGALRPYRLINRMSARFMREDGSEIDRATVKDAIHLHDAVADDVFQKLPYERIHNNRIVTIAPLLYECLETELQKLDMDKDKLDDTRRVLNAIMNYNRFHEGDELEKVTLEGVQNDLTFPQGGNVHIPGGYIQILNHLMKKIPKHSLLLQCEVVRVNWGCLEDEKVKVETKDGKRYIADHVIVTCSVGYLRKHHASLFTPMLPQPKINALNSLTLGRVNKIFLEFDQAVLAPSFASIAFAWKDTDTGRDQSKWFKRNFGFDQIFTKQNTVLGRIAGDSAEYMEKLTDKEIAETCVQLLRKFLRNENIPYPKAVLVSRWCGNPYVLGSYFHQTTSLFPGEQTVLSEPLTLQSGKPVLMYAGEALANACTHAAGDTGLQKAEVLVDYYCKNNLFSKL